MLVVREAYLTKKQMESMGIQDGTGTLDEDMSRRTNRAAAGETARQLWEKPYFPLYEGDHMDSPAAYYFTSEKVIVPIGLEENGLKEKIYTEWSRMYLGQGFASDQTEARYLSASEQQTARLYSYLRQLISSDGVIRVPALDFLSQTRYLFCWGDSGWKHYKIGSGRYSLPVWSYSLADKEEALDSWAKLYQKYGLVPNDAKMLAWLHDLPKTSRTVLTKEQYEEWKRSCRESDFLRLGNPYYLLSRGVFDDGRCWDVYEYGQPDVNKICCAFPEGEWLSAKAPSRSLVEGGLVSIDFGTKSTVVVVSDQTFGSLNTLKFKTEHEDDDPLYPTILKFCNLEAFMECYQSKAGRPQTLWNDVSIDDSEHESAGSDSALGIFRSLKQWMLDTDSREAVLRQKGAPDKPIILNEYGSDKNTVDPIELYAYYLGLHVNNNQNNKIFMRYRLSFSAVCPERIRIRMRESFRRGIRKSLPVSILNNKDIMENFSVVCTCSEPAAYAVCALACMGMPALYPQNFFYGIFDFGGGTCDFNYGIWRLEEDEKLHTVKYRIGMLGDGGDPYLGGENLLELLAVRLYMEKRKWFGEHGYKISRPRCYEKGNEDFFSTSFEAAHNLEFLVGQIRGEIWENSADSEEESEEFEIGVTGLLPEREDGGCSPSEFKIPVARKPLKALLVKRIYEGVSAFFHTCYRILEEYRKKEVPQLCVFLAGNSCRSKWVRIMFEKYVREELDNTYIKKVYVCDPMGSPEFKKYIPSDLWDEEQQEGMCEKISRLGDLDGKTGVAYGLALYGNKVEIDNLCVEKSLQYYIGTSVFFDVKVLKGAHGDRLAIGECVPFAASDICNLYYTQMVPKRGELRGVKPIMLNGQNVLMEENMICFVRADSRTEISIFAAPDGDPEQHDPEKELIFDLQSGRFRKQRTQKE